MAENAGTGLRRPDSITGFMYECEDCWIGEAPGIEVADSLDQLQGMLSPGEWEVEWRLAAGQTYADVAIDLGLSPDALKVRASRWRARIRRQLAAC